MLQNFLQNIWKRNIQNQANKKHFSNPEDIFKSAKNFLEKRNPKDAFPKTIISYLSTWHVVGS